MATHVREGHPTGRLGPAFADPVHDAQAVFRQLMTALSEPGRSVELGSGLSPPGGLSSAATVTLLTLTDFETPLWLGADERSGDTGRYLRFHCGVPLVDDPAHAVLAVLRGNAAEPLLLDFSAGLDAYPDQSATVIVEVEALAGGSPIRLTGPGLQTARTIAPAGLRAGFWAEVRANHARYPLGLDLILTSGSLAIGLPRSTLTEEV
jgi:alpha-D-ribose 1-methylphosphonate 5-triphosphate synthase subunit PhnH